MTDTYLKSWLDRVERLEEEQKGIGGDKRDLYAEAKGKGYNPKALRRIVAARKRKDEKEIQDDVDTYTAALGLAVDLVRNDKLSLREAARKTGASKSSIHRALAVPASSQVETQPAPVQTNNAPGETPVAEETPVLAVPAGEVEGTGEVTTPPPDDLAIPAFLDRRRQQEATR